MKINSRIIGPVPVSSPGVLAGCKKTPNAVIARSEAARQSRFFISSELQDCFAFGRKDRYKNYRSGPAAPAPCQDRKVPQTPA